MRSPRSRAEGVLTMIKLLIGTFIFLLASVSALHAAEPIKIGVYLPLSGFHSLGGRLELEGVMLAHKEKPVVLGREVRLLVADNKSDHETAAAVVKRLTGQDKVVGLIGTYGSSLAIAGAEVAEAARTPMLGTSCTSPLVTKGKKYIFRACFTDAYQGAGAATYARKTLNISRVAVLKNRSSAYALGLAGFFAASFKALGGSVVADVEYASGVHDFTPYLEAVIESKPELLFLSDYFLDSLMIIEQARQMGASFRIMGGDTLDNPEIVARGGASVEGLLHTTFPYHMAMPDMNAEARHFTERWKAMYPGKTPNVNAVLGYTCYMLFMRAIEDAGSDNRESITAALAAIQDFPTVTGDLGMNAFHDAETPVGLIEIQNGTRLYRGEVMPALR